MKIIGVFIFFVLFSGLVSAVQYACSDESVIITSSGEINEGEADSILGLPLGVCSGTENSYYQWVESVVFLDANLITLNSNSTRGIELKSRNDTINYDSISQADKATINIGSSSDELEIGECSGVGDVEAMLTSISGTGITATVKVLAGDSKITLNTKDNASVLVQFNSKEYAIELVAGSSLQSSFRVSKCNSGELIPVAVNPIVNNTVENQTISNSTTNETIQNQTTVNQTINQSSQNNSEPQCPNIGLRNGTKYCNPEGIYLDQRIIGESCYKSYECLSNYCKNDFCEKKGFFRSIIDWFKRLSF